MGRIKLFVVFFLWVGFVFFAAAQEDISYQKPSADLLAIIDYQREPVITMDSRNEYMLYSYRSTYKSLEEISQKEMRLAGLRINPQTNISSTMTYTNDLKLRKLMDFGSEPDQVKGLPANPQIAYISWSPDDKKIAFTNTTSRGVELWVVDVSSAKASKLTDPILNANAGRPYIWYKDSKRLLVRMLPGERKTLTGTELELPRGPVVSLSEGTVSQIRTYQDMLRNKMDEDNFETLVTSELYELQLNGKKSRVLGKAMYMSESFSPDGKYMMVKTIRRPFSYLVPLQRFPEITGVYDAGGKLIRTVNEVPLTEELPKGFSATRTGKRNMAWRNDKPSSLWYAEALDGGDPAVETDFRDAIFSWDVPFDKNPVMMARTQQRFSGILWGDENHAIITDSWYNTRNAKTYLVNPSRPDQEPRIVFDRNYQDRYNDPGSFETKKNDYGSYVLAIFNDEMFLTGDGFTAEGQFPFIDALNVKTLETQRLYQSDFTDKKEDITSVIDFQKSLALVMIQSPADYPNYYLRNYRKDNDLKQVTFSKNPFESFQGIEKQLINYKRDDGVELSGTLYLPAGYDKEKKEKLPLLIWAYPREFKDRATAGQITSNPNQFTFPGYGTFVLMAAKGYAVLDNAAFPIVGEGDQEPNDSFIGQLVANGRAAIDAVDRLGYIDRTRVGVGGHSYGAFMVANLLTHSEDFACGIARSGAYNRTLTPFGFQGEQRNFWDAPDVYGAMSPFYSAHKMKKPILLIHGEADNNSGTFPMQTERYFQALKGLGADARMVILPKEGHGYSARESIFHVLWEQEQFLEKCLKP